VLDAPIGQPFAGGQVMFTLPNGMVGFAILTASGVPVNELPACVSDCPPRATNLLTCSECHAGLNGPGPGDVVRDFATTHPENYDAATLAKIRQEFLSADELGGLIQGDEASNFDALEASGGPSISLPFAEDAFAWRQPLTPELAAQEAGLTVAQLRALLPRLHAESARDGGVLTALQSLGADGSKIERESFSAGFQQVLCARDGARNRPVSCP
jgi:hypothetical protein